MEWQTVLVLVAVLARHRFVVVVALFLRLAWPLVSFGRLLLLFSPVCFGPPSLADPSPGRP